MLAEVVVAGFTGMLTVAIGVPLAVRLARVHVWRRTAPADTTTSTRIIHTRNFEPLDFGEDLILWPSENARPRLSFPEPPWPSEKWDDPDFSRGGREAAAHLAESNRAAEAQQKEARARREAATRADVPAKPQPARKPQKQQPAKKVAKQPAQSQPAKPQPARPQAKPKPAPSKPRPAPQPSSGGEPYSREEVEQMIGELGLAGAVQQLMRTQGWDFKTAASWLARARKR